MRRVQQGVQAQAPPDGAQAAAQWREAVPMYQVPQTLLALGFVQSAHEPPLLVLQAVPRLSRLSKTRKTHQFDGGWGAGDTQLYRELTSHSELLHHSSAVLLSIHVYIEKTKCWLKLAPYTSTYIVATQNVQTSRRKHKRRQFLALGSLVRTFLSCIYLVVADASAT